MIKPMVIVVQEDGDKRVPVAIGRSQKSLARQLRAKANEVYVARAAAGWRRSWTRRSVKCGREPEDSA